MNMHVTNELVASMIWLEMLYTDVADGDNNNNDDNIFGLHSLPMAKCQISQNIDSLLVASLLNVSSNPPLPNCTKTSLQHMKQTNILAHLNPNMI